VEAIVKSYANAGLALAHAECAAKVYLFAETVLRDEILKLLNYLARTLDMAGGADTNCNFKHYFILTFFDL
jgi:hypothetical protein